jgi:hypothetical protein
LRHSQKGDENTLIDNFRLAQKALYKMDAARTLLELLMDMTRLNHVFDDVMLWYKLEEISWPC